MSKLLSFLGAVVLLCSTSAGTFAAHSTGVQARADIPTRPSLTSSPSGVHLGMMFNWNLQGNTQPEVGVDDLVWGASVGYPLTNNPAQGVTHLYYYPWKEDGEYAQGPGLAPFLNSHPDWIVYQNDRKTPAWAGGSAPAAQNRAPLDETNPAVQQFMMNTYIGYAITTGQFAGVSFDACQTLNDDQRAGVYNTAGSLIAPALAGTNIIEASTSIPAGTSISFGNASDTEYLTVTAAVGTTLTVSPALRFNHLSAEWLGQWNQQYDGSLADTAFRSAIITAFQQVVGLIKAANPNAVVIPNAIPAIWSQAIDQNGVHAYDYWRDLVPYADGVLDEGGMTNNAGGGNGPPYVYSDPNGSGLSNPWDFKMHDYQWASSLGKIVMIVDKEPYLVTTNMTSSNSQARFDLQWNLASYLLAQGNSTYLVWRGLNQTPNDAYNEPEYATAQAIGSPTDPMYQSQNVYMRDFSNGLAIENPSGETSYPVTLPTGVYQDLYGNPVNSTVMAPHSGLVLLGQSQNQATTTTVSADVNPSGPGQSVTFTATVTPTNPGPGTPTGAMTFFDGDTQLGTATLDSTGSATVTTSALLPGTHSITAAYGGDNTFAASSGSMSQTVDLATTTTDLTSSDNPTGYGETATFTATVSSPYAGAIPSAAVTFFDGSTPLATRTLDGASPDVATLTISNLVVAGHSITAVYSGDSNFSGSSSSAVTQQVTPGPALIVSPTTGRVGTKVTLQGSGFVKSETISLYLDTIGGQPIKSFVLSSGGTFGGTLSLPITAAIGPHTYYAVGSVTGTVSAPFQVAGVMASLISPLTELATYYVTTAGFEPGETVAVSILNSNQQVVFTATGAASGFMMTAPLPQGKYTLSVTGQGSGYQSSNTLIAVPQIALNPQSGTHITPIVVAGAGFAANSQETGAFGCIRAPCSSTAPGAAQTMTDATGSFSGLTLGIPQGTTKGSYTVGVSQNGSTPYLYASGKFVVTS